MGTKLSQTQIKVNMSVQLGVTMSEYIRHLIMKSIEDDDESKYQVPAPKNSIEWFRDKDR
ncbi:hypothetical protein KBD09_00080 [Candidatus Woesebacteria bacterium]|jgi:hypothetical protein|nr:hypothetical protein [Candidatus Woesebacteria bacterium]